MAGLVVGDVLAPLLGRRPLAFLSAGEALSRFHSFRLIGSMEFIIARSNARMIARHPDAWICPR